MSNYVKDQEKTLQKKLRALRDELPEFAEEFFVGIESQTTLLTRLNYAYDLKIFFDFLINNVRIFKSYDIYDFQVRDLEKITINHLEQFLEYLSLYEYNGKESSNNDRGKARKISAVRSFFKYYFARDKIEKNVASKIATPKLREKEIVRLDGAELERLLDSVENGDGLTTRQQKFQELTRLRDRAIFFLMLGTGIRVSECVGINLTDIDFNSQAFTITRKGGHRAILYFGDDVLSAIKRYIETEREALISKREKSAKSDGANIDTDALFLSLQLKRLSVRAVENIVAKYSKAALPLKQISPHKLRSTFGTNLYRETNDIYLVADVLGHKDVNTTKKHYAAMSDNHRKIASRVITVRDDR